MNTKTNIKIMPKPVPSIKSSTVLLLLIVLLMMGFQAKGQDSIMVKVPRLQPFRIGVKVGFPNAIGGHLEYVTPLLKKRLAPSIEYSTLKLDNYLDPGDSGKFTYFEAGLNYYFFRPGRGLYGHLGYGKLDTDLMMSDYNSKGDGTAPGTGSVAISNSSLNFRLGAKMGGLFYFRPEIGYQFSGLPENIDVDVQYPDGSRETITEEVPGLLSSGFQLNIGFGLAF